MTRQIVVQTLFLTLIGIIMVTIDGRNWMEMDTVFWPCGVTPQSAVENAKPPIAITHAPGHMFITDIINSELNDYLEAKKHQ